MYPLSIYLYSFCFSSIIWITFSVNKSNKYKERVQPCPDSCYMFHYIHAPKAFSKSMDVRYVSLFMSSLFSSSIRRTSIASPLPLLTQNINWSSLLYWSIFPFILFFSIWMTILEVLGRMKRVLKLVHSTAFPFLVR